MPGGTEVGGLRFFQSAAFSAGKIRGSKSKSQLCCKAASIFLALLFYHAVAVSKESSGNRWDGTAADRRALETLQDLL